MNKALIEKAFIIMGGVLKEVPAKMYKYKKKWYFKIELCR